MREPIEFETTPSFLLARVATAYRNALEHHMSKIGLHGGQVFLLIELWATDGRRQVDLADALEVKPPTVNKMVTGLIKKNLIVRQKIAGDKRSARIFLTPEGRAARAAVETEWIELEAGYLSDLSDIEQAILPTLLANLRKAYTGRTQNEDE